ncbi:MAG TPA: acetyl-CoA carboxylase biotin carboxyl carrier protein [Anaeromyxobacter sp.]|nr:acetyl-CoA carboxylase biotin carboxyl carrier protein [Anaeromyxobacter sp.]
MASRPLKQPADRAPSPQGAPGFSLDDVKSLVQLLEESDVTHIAWQRGTEKVVIRRGAAAPPGPAVVHALTAPAPAPVTQAVPAAAAPVPAAPPSAARDPKLDAPGTVVSSPFVGTFYRSPSPDQPPFVDVGQRVKKGQTICIIEAMKLMNEIESDVDGVVAEIMVPNATAVEFGEALFRIVPG